MSDQPQTKRVAQSSAAQDQESGARQGDPKDSTDSQAVLSDDIDVPSVKDPISDSKPNQGSAGSNAAPDLGSSEESEKIISEMPLLSGEDTTTLMLSNDDWKYIHETDYFKFSSDSSANERRLDYATSERNIEGAEWDSLCKAVGWISFNMNSVKWEDLSQRSQDYISSWANQPQKYIGREHGRELEKAWVWNILWDHLFSPDCAERWHGEPWASYGRVLRDLEGHLERDDNCLARTFQTWRTLSMRMLYPLHGVHSDVQRLVAVLKRELSEVLPVPLRPTVAGKLQGVAHLAVRVDLILQVQRYRSVMHMGLPTTGQRFGFAYSSHGLEIGLKDVEEERPVQFPSAPLMVATPSLLEPHELRGRNVDFVCQPGVRFYGRVLSRSAENRFLPNEELWHCFDKLRCRYTMKVCVDDGSPDKGGKDEQLDEADGGDGGKDEQLDEAAGGSGGGDDDDGNDVGEGTSASASASEGGTPGRDDIDKGAEIAAAE
ncbi:uncharacterized protein E0L32_012175 [Thyridium curvatum]|uniref:Uncharacterized protein n=1 Tax=Thyridium curvatum TaxID=1093900 RepID=A0A507BDH4_9PEZI|nr:uncharacterized protein E0L32_012175 [Thyridium curvatum]TPX17346.1 hypothetical protein E0L32_012175 [Thyridium curvatum]